MVFSRASLLALAIAVATVGAADVGDLSGWFPCAEYTFASDGSSIGAAECAIYTAPLCYEGICEDAGNATADIFVKRIEAALDADAAPNVWFLQGGPGASSTASTFILRQLQPSCTVTWSIRC